MARIPFLQTCKNIYSLLIGPSGKARCGSTKTFLSEPVSLAECVGVGDPVSVAALREKIFLLVWIQRMPQSHTIHSKHKKFIGNTRRCSL